MSTILTGDLRSNAKDQTRFKAHQAKWAQGTRPAAGKFCHHNVLWHTDCGECNKRPARQVTRNLTSFKQRMNKKELAKETNVTKKVFRHTVVEAVGDVHEDLSDSSGDFEVDDTSAAPELSEVMYSYDSATGPNQGGQILSFAINQAVQRFENNETEKIVKKEYDLVLDGKDEPEAFVADADDDFELIDGSHLQ